MEKWDGITDSEAILEALLYFIDEEDVAAGLSTSYGDFGKKLKKSYGKSGCGNGGGFSIKGTNKGVRISFLCKHVEYELTWNKAAKLIHTNGRK